MSRDLLRRAAAKMRERAEAAIEDSEGARVWAYDPKAYEVHTVEDRHIASGFAAHPDGEHIASWHPVVALAIADWLDAEDAHQFGPTEQAINVARAYLGEDG
jgi:hypothetical protein